MSTQKQDLLKQEVQLTLSLCEIVGSPRALAVSLLVKNHEWAQLTELEIDPGHYFNQTIDNFADDYLVTEILLKSDCLPIKVDLEQKAKAAFYAAESRCAKTNARLYGNPKPEWFWTYQREVQSIMGPLTESVLDKIHGAMRHGSGATTGVDARGLVASKKYDGSPHLTPNLIPFAKSIVGELWHMCLSNFTVVPGNKFLTVSKKATARRGICKEPDLNVYGQLGIGAHLGDRLRLFGVDIRNQGHNRALVKRAWKDELATIDMTQASDLMARAAVHESATFEWAHLLDLFRSPCTFIDGSFVELEKYSAMGNGYTFQLETILFLAVVRSVVPRAHLADTGVYGDDIIVPQAYAQEVINRLGFLGFEVNREKTHLAGEFFESCGSDTFRGAEVRPFYCRATSDKEMPVPYQVHLANQVRMYAKLRGVFGCDARFRPVWERLQKSSPSIWRKCRVPAHFGDTGIIHDIGEVCLTKAANTGKYRGWEGYLVRHAHVQSAKVDRHTMGVLLNRYNALDRGILADDMSKGREVKRGFLGRMRPMSTVTEWPSGLAWL